MLNAAEAQLDKMLGGRCSECRRRFEQLEVCMVCDQTLCDKCVLPRRHGACYDDTAVRADPHP